jgi:fatty-acyl-CoA synthase
LTDEQSNLADEERSSRRSSASPAGGERPILTRSDVMTASALGLPTDLPTSSYDLLRRSTETHGERVAIRYFASVEAHSETRTLTYSELFEGVTRTANMLAGVGVGRGDVVALLLPNLPETHLALWGAEAAGVVMPLNPLLEAKAVAALLSSAQAKVLIASGDDPALTEKMLAALNEAPSVRDLVLVSSEPDGDVGATMARLAALKGGIAVHHFAECVSRAPAEGLASGRDIGADEPASYFCTGGTTGLPKIAVRTHRQTIANAWMVSRMVGPAIDRNSVLFCGLPLFHVNAALITGMVPFLNGASVLLGTSLGYRTRGLIPKFWEIVEQHRVTAFSAVPTLLVSLLEHPTAGYDVASLRFAICGAAPLSAEVLERFERTCRISISEGYGMTETSCVASLNPIDGGHRPGSVGLPLPTEEIVAVILEEDGSYRRDAQTGEVGVVAITGPNIFSGYLDPRHNERVWIDRGDGRKWLNTGDLGRIDGDGYLWLTGRAKDLIIRGGHNIDPAVIEEALHGHPDVALAAAIGRPDARVGELPVAYVQLRDGASASEDDLLAHAAATIGERAAIPKTVTILHALPLTSVGKIHKPTLRHRESLAVTRQALEEAGYGDASIDLHEDGVGGATVMIRSKTSDERAIRAALQLYTFAYEVAAVP